MANLALPGTKRTREEYARERPSTSGGAALARTSIHMNMLDDPFIHGAMVSSVLPLGCALLLSLGIWKLTGAEWAAVAVVPAFLVSYLATLGLPPFPPVSSIPKLFYIAAAAGLVGVALQMFPGGRTVDRAAIVLLPGAIVGWLGWRTLLIPEFGNYAALGLLWLAGGFLFWRFHRMRETPLAVPTMVLTAGLGVSAVAFIGSVGVLSQFAAALAAAAGGIVLCNWPKRRYPFALAGSIGAAAVLFSIVTTMVLYSESDKFAIALLVLIPAWSGLHGRVAVFSRPVAGPVAFGAFYMLPAILATALALQATSLE